MYTTYGVSGMSRLFTFENEPSNLCPADSTICNVLPTPNLPQCDCQAGHLWKRAQYRDRQRNGLGWAVHFACSDSRSFVGDTSLIGLLFVHKLAYNFEAKAHIAILTTNKHGDSREVCRNKLQALTPQPSNLTRQGR